MFRFRHIDDLIWAVAKQRSLCFLISVAAGCITIGIASFSRIHVASRDFVEVSIKWITHSALA